MSGDRSGRMWTTVTREERASMGAIDDYKDRRWDMLTPAEKKVIALVTEGLTNPQIAERLFVSTHTVQTHMKHVFRKLKVVSRSELAALAAKHLH